MTPDQFHKLRSFAFSAENRGYRPEVIEAPNGDGKLDQEKRYAHIAPKYGLGPCADIYWQALYQAQQICSALLIPKAYSPGLDSTLRVLEYPPGATSAPHTDFDMFTLSLYRDVNAFRYLGGNCSELIDARRLAPGIHFGELLTEIMGWPATKHEVIATEGVQLSAVFFAMPPLGAVLPNGVRVRDWLEERKNRSRVAR